MKKYNLHKKNTLKCFFILKKYIILDTLNNSGGGHKMASRSRMFFITLLFSFFISPALADVVSKKENFIRFLLPLIKDVKAELGGEYTKIPNSLIIAQAAVETGWGYRYPLGNLFGIAVNGKYKKFSSEKEGIKFFLENLLSHSAYKDFQEKIDRGETDSINLVSSLKKYTSEDENYLQKVKSIIRREKLQEYDTWWKDDVWGAKSPL